MKVNRFLGMAVTIAALTLSPALVFAQTPRIQMVEVVSSGFSGPGEKVVLGKIRRTFSRTPGMKATPGTAFGITVRPVGEPAGAEIALRWVWKAPRPGVRNKSGKLVRQISEETVAKIGDETQRTYEFKDASDIVRGNWRVEVWNGRRRLAVRRFAIR